MSTVLKDAVGKRMTGDRPSPVHASLAAIVAGATVAVITYRVMRN